MNDKLRRILDLVRRTGDTMVVTDPDGDEVFVVMGLKQYETLVGGKPQKSVPDTRKTIQEQITETPDIWETMKPAGEKGETWDLSKMGEEELVELENQYRQFAQKNVEEAIAELSPVEEEIKEKPLDSTEFGEEQFYLEPIE